MSQNQESGNKTPAEIITVRMGEWREAQGDATLETRNLGPCIGLALHEPTSLRGFLAHMPLPQDKDSEYRLLEDRLREVFVGQPGSFGRMKAWLSGGSSLLASAMSPKTEAFVKQNRDFVVDALSDIGILKDSVEIRWTPNGYLSANMSLDCAAGTCQIDFTRPATTPYSS